MDEIDCNQLLCIEHPQDMRLKGASTNVVFGRNSSSGVDIILGERLVIFCGVIRHGAEMHAWTRYLSKRLGALNDKGVSVCG